MPRYQVSQKLANSILAEYDDRCYYCGGWAGEIDHIISLSKGGRSKRNNLVAACRVCNMIANNKLFESVEHKRRFILLRRYDKGLY